MWGMDTNRAAPQPWLNTLGAAGGIVGGGAAAYSAVERFNEPSGMDWRIAAISAAVLLIVGFASAVRLWKSRRTEATP